MICFLGVLAVFAPVLTDTGLLNDPLIQFETGLDADGLPVAPGGSFLLGADMLGRDVLSRVVHGSRISLTVGVIAMCTAVGIGVAVGLLAGYFGTWVNTLLMRITDVMITIPGLLLAIALAGLMDGRVIHLHPTMFDWHIFDFTLKRGMVSILLVIGLISWTWIARVVRAQVMAVRARDFIDAASAVGCSHLRIITRHILPNIAPSVIVLASLNTANTVLLDAGLSFLGVGVPPPAPSWGVMIAEAQPYFIVSPHLTLVPGMAIVFTVVGFNLLGQGLQDVLDPYVKGTR
ncbi:MAG: ABC transporter permease [candidate division Zixibacteria bacterium]|nr:ABC transporter permease [candidate division Zixibacteria bacterium]